jgi:hypothetical protein
LSKKTTAAGTIIVTGGDREAAMRLARVGMLLALVMFGVAGCVVEEHHDGGVTVRPVH